MFDVAGEKNTCILSPTGFAESPRLPVAYYGPHSPEWYYILLSGHLGPKWEDKQSRKTRDSLDPFHNLGQGI